MMKIATLKFFQDNYSYAFFNGVGKLLGLVDPADFDTVHQQVKSDLELQNLEFSYVFTTHKHFDHAGDNQKIRKLHPEVVIIGGEEVPSISLEVKGGDSLNLPNNIRVEVLHTPCHTRGHLMYYMTYQEQKVLFSGDTLFVGGCGRFFEGDAADMLSAVEQVKKLPDETEIYCGHEYTLGNLEWAARIDHENLHLLKKLDTVRKLRLEGKPTVPTTVKEEKLTNLFMMTNRMKDLLKVSSETEAMEKLRKMKNEGETLI